jgi:hypothetical protein
MDISSELQRPLRERGVYVTEACDRCGRVLGPVRYMKAGDSGAWCSRQCRDGAHAHVPGTCRACGARLPEGKRRGAKYCEGACKQSAHRSRADVRPSETPRLSVTDASICAVFSSSERAVRPAGHPRANRAPDTLPLRFAGGVE